MMALMSVPHRFRIRVSRNSSNNDINFLYVVSHEAQYEVLASDFAPLHSHWYFRRFVFYQLQNIRKQIFTFYLRVMQWVICYPYRQFVKQFLIVYITWCCYSALWLFDKLVHIFILLIYCLAVTYLGGGGLACGRSWGSCPLIPLELCRHYGLSLSPLKSWLRHCCLGVRSFG